MIEWIRRTEGEDTLSAYIGEFTLRIEMDRTPFLWTAMVNLVKYADGVLHRDVSATLEQAQAESLDFARTWIAAQVAALGDGGEWTSVLPNAPGYYWYRIPAPDEDSLEPDTWTDVRLQLWNRPALIGTLGCSVQFWSVPVEPPPLPEVTDES